MIQQNENETMYFIVLSFFQNSFSVHSYISIQFPSFTNIFPFPLFLFSPDSLLTDNLTERQTYNASFQISKIFSNSRVWGRAAHSERQSLCSGEQYGHARWQVLILQSSWSCHQVSACSNTIVLLKPEQKVRKLPIYGCTKLFFSTL